MNSKFVKAFLELGVNFLGSNPFAFQDSRMELRYQEFCILTCLDRNKIIPWFIVPFFLVMRIMLFAYWFVYPEKMNKTDIIVSVLRISCQITVITMYTVRWGMRWRRILGLALIWIFRFFYAGVFYEQAFSLHSAPHVFTVLAFVLCFTGMIVTTFSEYLAVAFTLPFIRPLVILLTNPADDTVAASERAQRSLFDHSLVLALGLSITWTIHADRRRDWLLSCTASAGRGPEAARQGVCEEGAADGFYGALAKEAMLAEVVQVRSQPHHYEALVAT
jgi:hypothetical protein